MLLGFHGRLEAVGPLPLVGHAARGVVHELDPRPSHDVVDVSRQQALGVESVAEPGEEAEVLGGVEVAPSEGRLGARESRFREGDVVRVLVRVEVLAGRRTVATRCGEAFEVGGRRGWRSRDDERNAGLVDEDGVGLVHAGRRGTGGGRDPPGSKARPSRSRSKPASLAVT